MNALSQPLPPHPGFLLRRFLNESGMPARSLAVQLGICPSALHYILHGRNGLTASTAVRLAAISGIPARRWLELQSRYDIELARQTLADELSEIVPCVGPWRALSELCEESTAQVDRAE